MGQFLPQLIGFGFVALLLGFVVLFPRSPWTATLLERYGVRARGTGAQLTRADYFRGAAAAFAISMLLCTISFGWFALAERLRNGARGNLLASEFAFMFTLLGALSFACAVIAVWNGLRWRPPVGTQGPDEPTI